MADVNGIALDPELVNGSIEVTGAILEIPTLGEWSLGLLVLLLAMAGVHVVRSGGTGLSSGGPMLALLLIAGGVLMAPGRLAAQVDLPGDANADGMVDSADIPAITEQILERSDAMGNPDCNRDATIDVRDTICVVIHAAPELDSLADEIGIVAVLVSVQASADDPDPGDELTYSLDQAPAGMTVDAVSGLVQWTPSATQVGVSMVVVRVTDSRNLFDTEGFSVDVKASNVPPVLIPIDNLNVLEREVVGLRANANDADLPDDELTWSLPVGPIGATMDPLEGTILWVPTAAQVGDHVVTVRVNDAAGEFDEESFTVTVSPTRFAAGIERDPRSAAGRARRSSDRCGCC